MRKAFPVPASTSPRIARRWTGWLAWPLLLLGGCGGLPLEASGKLPSEAVAAADYVRQYCGSAERERIALAEGMRRVLWPDAQVIIVCDH